MSKKRGETFKEYGLNMIYFNKIEVDNENVLKILKGDG